VYIADAWTVYEYSFMNQLHTHNMISNNKRIISHGHIRQGPKVIWTWKSTCPLHME